VTAQRVMRSKKADRCLTRRNTAHLGHRTHCLGEAPPEEHPRQQQPFVIEPAASEQCLQAHIATDTRWCSCPCSPDASECTGMTHQLVSIGVCFVLTRHSLVSCHVVSCRVVLCCVGFSPLPCQVVTLQSAIISDSTDGPKTS
jgi:hypothetical protein